MLIRDGIFYAVARTRRTDAHEPPHEAGHGTDERSGLRQISGPHSENVWARSLPSIALLTNGLFEIFAFELLATKRSCHGAEIA